jgi:uncharacterized protein YndB with AHSA1/START domain
MAYTAREIAAGRDAVFAVLIDPHTYPAWLVGNAEVRHVDDAWPTPGSAFHHRVGAWPLTLADSSRVIDVDPGRRLRLDVRARPFIRAVATFTLVGDDSRTVVSLEEEPTLRWIGNLVRPLLDPLTHVRNHASLRRLADYLEDGAGPTTGGADPVSATPDR